MKHPEVRLVNYSIMIRKLLLQYIVRTKKQNLQVKWVLYKKLPQLFASEKDFFATDAIEKARIRCLYQEVHRIHKLLY